ncbi:MAG: LysM domain-containing protein [Candidatus Gastranaerophilales bacterium]|nr:LysM domain-containing protein [Candidatus Gastranaerophilales bacterium]
MKSSTLRRSNLSKERMLVLEELSKNKKQPYDASPGVYVRANKEKELDVLWQNFKVSQKEDKSPGIYLATGFIAGAVAMLIMTTLLSFSVRGGDDVASVTKNKEKAKLTFIPADKNTDKATVKENVGGSETYTVKNGDTLAGIIMRFYGKYDISKIDKIKEANKMSNPNNLQIGQNLIIPMD